MTLSDTVWSLLMPATRPSCAWAALWSASTGQTVQPSEVIVADNGPVSVTASMEWRFVADVLAHSGIPVRVHRVLPSPEVNVGRMRHLLLSNAEHDLAALCDDDVLWEPRVAEELLNAVVRNVPWATALQLTPNNESDIRAWTAPAFPSEQFGDEPDGIDEVSRSSGHALFLHSLSYDGFLDGWSLPTDDDDALTRHLGVGVRVVAPGCRVWEMAHPENRKWRPNAESRLT